MLKKFIVASPYYLESAFHSRRRSTDFGDARFLFYPNLITFAQILLKF